MLTMMSQFWRYGLIKHKKKLIFLKTNKKIHIRTCFPEWAKNYRIKIAKITKFAIISINL